MKKNLSVVLFALGLTTSCGQDDRYSGEELIGVWHGVGTVDRSAQNGESLSNQAPYFIAFAYDNGLSFHEDGKLIARCADDLLKPQEASWSDCYEDFGGKWNLANELLILNDIEYEIVSVTPEELIIRRQVNSDLSSEIILEKQ